MPSTRDLSFLVLPALVLALLPSLAAAQPRPVIERIEPASGPVGIQVQLIGRQIHPSSQIMLGNTVLPTVRRHPGRWIVQIPEGARSGNITIRTRHGEFRGPYFRVTASRPTPVINRMNPTSGGPGTEVTLEGENFAPRIADNRVTLGNRPVVVRSATPTRLVLVVPSGATNGRFLVRVSHAGETQSDQFSVGASTTITDMTPRSGPPGTQVRLIGTGFAPRRQDNRVYINNRPLRVINANATRIQAVIPEGAASGTILVDVQGGGRAESPAPFVIQHTPTIASFAPSAAAPGRRVIVRGTRFGRDPRVVQVTIGGRQVTLRRVTPARIELEIPAGTPTGKIAVTINGVGPTESATDFTVLSPVRIADFAPRTGAGDTEITIRGAGFSPVIADNHVFVGRNRIEVLAASTTELRVKMTAPRSGLLRVRVPHNGEARATVPFVLTEPPIVSSISPTSGAPGTEVTIRGQRFGTTLSLVSVRMGTRQMQLRSVADTEIIAIVPAGATTERISVAVRLQGTGASQARFRVASPFSVTAIRPAQTFVGDTIILTGEGLVDGATVRFPGARRPVRGQLTNAGLAVVVPRGARTGPLTVSLPDRRAATSPSFTVIDAPQGVAITEVTPSCYRSGCHVIVRGHGFSASVRQNRVTFGDRPVRVESASTGRLVLRLPAAPGTNRFRIDVRNVGVAESEAFTIVP